jgi:hypothetical protein
MNNNNTQQILKEKEEHKQYIIKKCIVMNTIFENPNCENKLNDIFTIRMNSYMEKNPYIVKFIDNEKVYSEYKFDKYYITTINSLYNIYNIGKKIPSLIREDNYDFDKIRYEIINTMCNDPEVLNIINTDYIDIINDNIKDRFGFYIKHRNIIETSLLIGGVFLFISASIGILTLLCKFWYWIIF